MTITILKDTDFYFIFCLFCHVACGILVPQPGIEPGTVAGKAQVLTTGPPGNSQDTDF